MGRGTENYPFSLPLTNPKTRMDLMKLRGRPLFFDEHLTERQHGIMYQSRVARRNGLLQKSWSWDGLIWGLVDSQERLALISDYDYLKEQNELHDKQKSADEDKNGGTNDEDDMDVEPENGNPIENKDPTVTPQNPQDQPSTSATTAPKNGGSSGVLHGARGGRGRGYGDARSAYDHSRGHGRGRSWW